MKKGLEIEEQGSNLIIGGSDFEPAQPSMDLLSFVFNNFCYFLNAIF